MKRKRWWRILRRYLKLKHPARAIRQWFSKPSKAIRRYKRADFAIRFARRQREKYERPGKRARWWTKRIRSWREAKRRYREQMEAVAGPREIIPRSAWDDNPGDRQTTRLSNESGGFFVHHTVSGSPTTPEGEKAEMRNLERIARSRGFADISYSFIVFPSGRIYEGRGRGYVGAHTVGYNSTSHAGSAAGNYEVQEPTEAMVESFRWLIGYLNASQVRPHWAVYSTACPGRNLIAALKLWRFHATQ